MPESHEAPSEPSEIGAGTSTAQIMLRVPAADPVLRGGVRFGPPAGAELIAHRLARGMVVIDKPAGCTSHDVVERVRRLVGHGQVGHAGTLDPEVTGVLPLGLGQGTRVLQLLLAAGKTYDTRMRLHAEVAPERVREVLDAQVGTIIQLPPVRSRVKRVERPRRIYDVQVTEVRRREVHFRVRCEAGTYIRKLCHDIGEQLGCGAHMAWLRRTHAGGFSLADACTLDSLADAVEAWRKGDEASLSRILRPLEAALPPSLPRLWIHEGAVPRVANGVALFVPGVLANTPGYAEGDDVALQVPTGELVALGHAGMSADDLAFATRGIAARAKRVLWPPPGQEAQARS